MPFERSSCEIVIAPNWSGSSGPAQLHKASSSGRTSCSSRIDGQKSEDICGRVGVSQATVNKWLDRNGVNGVDALLTDLPRLRVGAHGGTLTTAEALSANPTLAADALADFRAFAGRQGHTVPAGAQVDARLQRMLLPAIAWTKWGDPGFYRILAVMDPQVRTATGTFDRAAQILQAQ
jgi:hypothetical protein